MTLRELRTFSRLLLQNIKGNQLGNEELDIIIKSGVVQVAADVAPLTRDSLFNAEADTSCYAISEIAPDYLGITEVGLWWNAGTADSPDWTQVLSKTRKWLDTNVPSWRDADSGSPRYYFIEGDTLCVHPAPADELADGFRLNHVYKPQPMDNTSNYPFEGETLIPHLEILDDCILAYVKWKLTPVSGEKMLENPYEAAYFREVEKKRNILRRRPDISNEQSSFKRAALRPRRYGRK